MRTSQVARQTARVADSLSEETTQGPRRSLRSFTHASRDVSEPSSHILDDVRSMSSNSSLGKRKRLSATDAVASVTILETTTRKSPRKPGVKGEQVDDDRKPRRQPAKRIRGVDGALSVEPPTNWETVYNVTTAMRKRVVAPVDTMGCESLAEERRSPKDQRLQTLIALMLSSQTKDTVTAVAMKNLQADLPGGFCLESLLKVEPTVLNSLIQKVGFHNNKTKFIKAVAVILKEKFGGDIPDTIEGLISLPGVGPKMAYLCMSAAWGRTEGIGVDVHVHRITNLWGWHKTSTPEQTREELEAWLPKEKWHDINHLLVGLGQTICLPIGRRCGECELSSERLCPSAVASEKVKRRVKKEVEVKIEDGSSEPDAVAGAQTGSHARVKVEDDERDEIGVSGSLLTRGPKSPDLKLAKIAIESP